MDIEYASFTKTPSFVYNQREKESLIPNYAQDLLEAYASYYNQKLSESENERDLYDKRVKSFGSKKCFCGATLKYISSYDFWGCTDYKNVAFDHCSFSGKNPIICPLYVSIKSTWVTEIIASCNLKGKVFAKEVYEFFLSNGLEDLRIKYGKTSTEKSLTTLIKAKARSKDQELKALSFLQDNYDKVVYQQCITYKIKGGKEAFCIPDYIVSDEYGVLVVDAKLDYANDDKMDMYVSLVTFILRSRNDQRKVSGAHIMYDADVSEYFKSRHSLLTIPA